MKSLNSLKLLIKEMVSQEMPLKSYLTFPDGVYPREDVSDSDKLKAIELIGLNFEYLYNAKHADGVIITFPDGKEYLVTHNKEVIPYKQ